MEDLNAAGYNILVYKVEATFRRAARLGDRLRVSTELELPVESPYRLSMKQSIHRGEELVNQALVQLVCVDEGGALQPFPEEILRL